MLKVSYRLAVIALIAAHASPASAHFSQVFGPFKAQLRVALAETATARSICEGRYLGDIGAAWIAPASE